MSKITLGKSQRVSIYLKEYYGSKRPITKYIRLFGGPSILVISFYNYYYSDVKWISALSGFTIVFGFYYILKPFITILIKPLLFEGYSFDFSINSKEIILTEGENISTLDHSFFENVQEWNTFFSLKTEKNQVLHLPKEELTDAEISELQKLVSS